MLTEDVKTQVELAIANLEKQDGVQHLADAVKYLLYAFPHPGHVVSMENLKKMVSLIFLRFPPNPSWTDEEKARSEHHFLCALQVFPDEFNRDLAELLERVK